MPKHRQLSQHQRIANSLRGWGAMLGIYQLCDNAACRRAKTCRGEARSCFRERFMQLPELVRNFWMLLLAAKAEGLTFDEAVELLLPRAEIHAWEAWMRKADESHLTTARMQIDTDSASPDQQA